MFCGSFNMCIWCAQKKKGEKKKWKLFNRTVARMPLLNYVFICIYIQYMYYNTVANNKQLYTNRLYLSIRMNVQMKINVIRGSDKTNIETKMKWNRT